MVQCVCGEILPKNRYALQRHEAKTHEYNVPSYKVHSPKKLSKDEFDALIKLGEEKFKHAIIIVDVLVSASNDNTKGK
jgi:hypothetical protein